MPAKSTTIQPVEVPGLETQQQDDAFDQTALGTFRGGIDNSLEEVIRQAHA